LASVVAVAALNWLLPSPHIEEGHNVYIPVGTSLDVFNTELPPDAQRKMQQIFDESYINDPKNLPGSPDWWKSPVFAQQPSRFVDHAFSTSSDALWQQPKYSRTADAIDFTSQEQARIGAINRIAYNFYRRSDKKNHQSASGFATDARIDRSSMPFFVMLELNGALAGGEICWRGQTLWEEPDGQFSLVDHADRACRAITEQDQGKRVFALAIAPDKPLSFTVYPNLPHRATLWAKIAARVLGVFIVLAALVRIETISQLLLPIGAVVSTLLTILIISPDFLLGFHTYLGGNDGLTHESLGFSISQALALGHFKEAFRGENVFYFMPGLRYLKAIEDMLFGDTNFGMILCTGFIPIFLYFIISRLFPLRWSVCLILIFMFIPIFERFGFAQFLYVREMIKGFPEPVGYGAFLGALALIAWSVPMLNAAPPRSPMPSGWIGLALALSVAMRPNLVHRMPGEGVPDLSGADYVTLCDVLHHVPPEAKASFLKDITEKMRPGAVLVLVDIDASRRGGSWMNQLHDLIVSQEWVVPVAAHVARSMLQQAGMVIREESFVRSLWYPHYLILAEKPSVPSATPAKPLAPMSAAPG
jgi:hypothetical protein